MCSRAREYFAIATWKIGERKASFDVTALPFSLFSRRIFLANNLPICVMCRRRFLLSPFDVLRPDDFSSKNGSDRKFRDGSSSEKGMKTSSYFDQKMEIFQMRRNSLEGRRKKGSSRFGFQLKAISILFCFL